MGKHRTRIAIFLLLTVISEPGARAAVVVDGGYLMPLTSTSSRAFKGYMVFEGERILALGKGAFPDGEFQRIRITETIDANGKIVMPGFVSGHSHLWQTRSASPSGANVRDGDVYQLTLYAASQQLRHGITTTYNHTHRQGTSEAHYLESFEAQLNAGQHFIFAYQAPRRSHYATMAGGIESFVDYAKAYIGKSPLLALGLHPASGFHDTAKLGLEVRLAKALGLEVQLDYLESFDERFRQRKLWLTLLKVGAVSSNVTYAHFIHTTDKILQDTVGAGAAMIWNPSANGRRGSGLANIPRYLEMDIGVGMGVGSTFDPYENIRLGLYGLRAQYHNPRVLLPIELLKLHTVHTAEVLKVAESVGSLEAGKYADFLIVDPPIPVAGKPNEIPGVLVHASSAADIDQVYVAGELRVDRGRLIQHDLAALRKQWQERAARLTRGVAGPP